MTGGGVLSPRNDQLVDALGADFQRRYEASFAWRVACSMYQALPGLRGFWPTSAFGSTGQAFDLSGNGRTLTYNGDPEYNYVGLAPYLECDGTGDYLSRADEAGLDIIGNESYVGAAAQGLTLGLWIWWDVVTINTFDGIIGKWGGVGQRAYNLLAFEGATRPYLGISVDGTAQTLVVHPTTPVIDTWYFLAGRFDPSAQISIFLNDVPEDNAVAIPATIFNSNAAFEIMRRASGAGTETTGRCSFAFLCAAALSDAQILGLFHQTKAMFGVT